MAPKVQQRKQRRHGEGTIDVMPDGRHRWRGYTNTATGDRKRVALYAKSVSELQKKIRKFHADEERSGYTAEPSRQTVSAYCADWLTNVVMVRCRPTTAAKYRHDLNRILKHIGNRSLATLQPGHVQAALKAMSEHYASTTVERSLDVLQNALETAVKHGTIQRNAARLVAPPKVEQYQARSLSLLDARQLLEAAREERLEVLYHVALTLGLRRGELLGIRWQDIDFERKELTIAQQVTMLNGRPVIIPPKTDESRSTVPLPDVLIPHLRRQQEHVTALRAAYHAIWQDHDLVFPADNGNSIAPRNLLREFKRVLRRAGLPESIRIHELRHFCGSFLAAAKVHPKVAQRILRHADIRTTLMIYTHTTEDQHREAADVLALALNPPEILDASA